MVASRSFWSGWVRVGLVSFPVGLASATSTSEGLRFVTIHRGCGERVAHPRECPEHGRLESEEIARAWEFTRDGYLEATDEELDAAGGGKVVEVERFVAAAELDELARDRAYVVVPAGEPVGLRPYVLMADVLERTSCVALGRVTLRQRTKACAVRARDGALLLETLVLPETLTLREASKTARAPLTDEERDLAGELVERMRGPAKLGELIASQDRALEATLRRKLVGDEIQPAPNIEPAPVDLAGALRNSLELRRGGRRRGKTASGAAV